MPMFKICSQCGGLHDFNAASCRTKRAKRDTKAVRFRNTSRWQRKRKEIRARDRYLCQICLIDAYDTRQTYTYDNIEVNHIVPIEEDISRALDNENLISLCSFHHKMADKAMIPRPIMHALTQANCDIEAIQKMIAGP